MHKNLNTSRNGWIVIRWALVALMCVGLQLTEGTAQSIYSASSLSLSGSGIAYHNGPEAIFWNPANMMISDRPGHFHLSMGGGVLTFNPVLPNSSIRQQLTGFADTYLPYEPGSTTLNFDDRQRVLRMHYADNALKSTHHQQANLLLGGALWQKDTYAFSIALRGRYASTIETGRGWYDPNFIDKNGSRIRDFSLTHRRSEHYELAAGYAHELTYINGLLPGVNKFFVGIAPKLIVAGSRFNARYDAQYIDTESSSHSFVSKFDLQSSGSISQAVKDYQQSHNPHSAIKNNLNNGYSFEPTGLGIGFDFGLSYLIPLENLSGDPFSSQTMGKSVRVAFSITDIGAIRYYEHPLTIEAANDTIQAGFQAPTDQFFRGSAGQYISYLHQAGSLPNPIIKAEQQSGNHFTALLPTSINTGILLDLSRIKFMGDLTLGLKNTAFYSNDIAVHLGMEARVFKPVPIRLGTILTKERPFTLGLGTGLETRHWDFIVGTELLFQSESPNIFFSGGAFGGLQLHF